MNDADERARKAHLLASERWRRAMFEFNAWLDAQPVYTPEQVRRIRGELAERVAAMSSFEVEYLMETLDAKLAVLESPAARDARGWLGRYLAVMSDAKRAEVLRGVPDILDMTAAELEAAVREVEARRAEVERTHDDVLAARRSFGRFQEATRRADATERARLSELRGGGPSFSPYRGPPVAATPFADAYETPSAVGVGPWGSYLAFPVGAF
ncbi:MAG: hypothetical protein ACKOCX_04930 [Planctomycetota bacterium]